MRIGGNRGGPWNESYKREADYGTRKELTEQDKLLREARKRAELLREEWLLRKQTEEVWG